MCSVFCGVKSAELPVGDPRRKHKGRGVFKGCDVEDEDGAVAMFMELSSCPATIDAGKACDAYGMMEGNILTYSS